jgi:hypothetical protein
MEPTTDDRPFYFFLREKPGQPAGRDVLVLRRSIATIGVLIAIFLVPPLWVLRRRRKASGEGGMAKATAYFALLGLGFMLIEMKLLQQTGLVIGQPTLTLSAVLASLLLSSGIGALLAERIAHSPGRRRAILWVAGLLGLVVMPAALVLSEPLANVLTAYALPIRVGGVVLSIAPLGVLLGCPLPLGMATIVRGRGLVAWCWGINGMLGVAGSAVSIYFAIHYGLRMTFLMGMGCYWIALAMLVLSAMREESSG